MMGKKRNIVLLFAIFLILIFSTYTKAKNNPLTLTQIMQNPAILYTKKYGVHIPKQTKCEYIQKLPNGNYIIQLICLKNPLFSKEQFTTQIDTIWPYIKDFDQTYDTEKESFSFSGNAQPLFKNKNTQKKYNFLKQLKQNITEQQAFFPLSIQLDQEIELTVQEVALAEIQHYSFYPARRFIHELGPCSRINYRIATASIDKKFIPAHEIFNINKRIGYRRGYCKGRDNPNRPFYGGACGASTQVFRIGLLHPFLHIQQREHHGIWYSRYYGEKITGDDSSIIDFRQQLILKNTSNEGMYFRYIEVEKDKNVILVAISPTKYNKKTKITKKQTGPLSAYVLKEIFGPQHRESYQERDSKYRLVDNGFTE